MLTFPLAISYTQISVFEATLANPFNAWDKLRVAQGFSWRDGSAGFATLQDGATEISVTIHPAGALVTLRPAASRAIEVPFLVPAATQVEIASIADSHRISIPPGRYQLVYQTGLSAAGAPWAEFGFYPSPQPSFAILRADPALHPPARLVETAAPPA